MWHIIAHRAEVRPYAMSFDALHEAHQGVWIGDSIVVDHPNPVSFELQCLLLADGCTSCRPSIVFQTNDIDILPVFLRSSVWGGRTIVDDDDPVGSLGSVQDRRQTARCRFGAVQGDHDGDDAHEAPLRGCCQPQAEIPFVRAPSWTGRAD